MAHERGEQRVLRAAQVDRPSVDGRLPRGVVDRDGAAPQDRLHVVIDAPQHRLGPRHYLVGVERFDHVVIGAAVQAGDAIGVGFAGREHDDRYGRFAAQDAAHLHPVEARQHQIEHDQVRAVRAGKGDAGASVAGDFGAEPGAFEMDLEPVGDPRLVFDDQNRAPRHDASLTGAMRRLTRTRRPVDSSPAHTGVRSGGLSHRVRRPVRVPSRVRRLVRPPSRVRPPLPVRSRLPGGRSSR